MNAETRKNVREYIASVTQHYTPYHDHKEQMAFGATALYLTGVTAFVFQTCTSWTTIFPHWATILIAVMFSALALLFVQWQLSNRAIAADMVDACTNLTTKWLEGIPDNLNLSPTRYNGMFMPQFLEDELSTIPAGRSTALPTAITLLAVVIWSVILILRIVQP